MARPRPRNMRNRRNINSVYNALVRQPTTPKRLSGYLSCRFNPLNSKSKSKIPDGRAAHSVQLDSRGMVQMECDQEFTLRILPILPHCVSITADTAAVLKVDGVTVPAGFKGTNNEYTPYMPQIMSTFSSGGFGTSTGTAKARVSTIGYRLIYTGKALDAQGVVIANFTPFSVGPPETSEKPISYVNNAGVVAEAPAGSYIIARAEGLGLSSSVPVYADTYSGRPELGAMGVLKKTRPASQHDLKFWHQDGIILINDDYAPTSATFGSEFNSIPQAHTSLIGVPVNNLVDDSFAITYLRIPPGKFQLEVLVCYEMELSTNSGLIPFSSKSPAEDKDTLDAETHVNDALPVAIPVDQYAKVLDEVMPHDKFPNSRKVADAKIDALRKQVTQIVKDVKSTSERRPGIKHHNKTRAKPK